MFLLQIYKYNIIQFICTTNMTRVHPPNTMTKIQDIDAYQGGPDKMESRTLALYMQVTRTHHNFIFITQHSKENAIKKFQETLIRYRTPILRRVAPFVYVKSFL